MSEKFEEKTLDAYSYDARGNVTENGVIMVTVTLDEYRELVAAKAKAEQQKHDLENWQLRQEVERLKQQIVSLTAGGDAE
jgi:hypothetical protein